MIQRRALVVLVAEAFTCDESPEGGREKNELIRENGQTGTRSLNGQGRGWDVKIDRQRKRSTKNKVDR